MSSRAFRPFGGGPLVYADGHDGRVDTSCFADEVSVDFPSVAPAVERIRRAFLAEERAAALSATIRLSILEARTGATVPLEVPVESLCIECGGRGETWTERCSRCDGSGAERRRHQLKVSVTAGVSDGARFHFTVIPRHDPPTRVELHVLVA